MVSNIRDITEVVEAHEHIRTNAALMQRGPARGPLR